LNWYLRDYKQQYFFGANPTRDLLEYPVILVGDNNWTAVEPLLADRFNRYEYIRMWWPNQDYWNLKRSAIEAERNFEAPPTEAERSPMGTADRSGTLTHGVRRIPYPRLGPYQTVLYR
jgi:hypothetical protein